MTNKEILAELKKSYEYLTDIRFNGCADHFGGQLDLKLINMLEVAINNVENIYFEFYKTLNKETLRVKSLETNRNKVYIANDVSIDYETEDESFTCEDVDYIWYDDQKFLDNSELDYKYENI